MTDEEVKKVYKKFRKLPEEKLIYDIKRIHKNNPINQDVLTKLEMRNPNFASNIFLKEGREISIC